MSSVIISPHNDDESLFAAYTCIRERPLIVVVTDSYIQPNRGDRGCSAQERFEETCRAGSIMGCPVISLGLRDDTLDVELVQRALSKIRGFGTVYAPAIQGGNWQHDLIGKCALEVFGEGVRQYTTYTKTELWTKGNIEIVPTEEEKAIKNKALACYQSQLNLNSTRPHFIAVINKSEWLM